MHRRTLPTDFDPQRPLLVGLLPGTPARVLTLPFGLLIPIAAGVVLFWRWPLLRRIIEVAPQSWIVSVQAYRVEGLIFLILYAGGLPPGAFAPVVGVITMDGACGSSGWLRAWNLLGIVDLVVP